MDFLTQFSQPAESKLYIYIVTFVWEQIHHLYLKKRERDFTGNGDWEGEGWANRRNGKGWGFNFHEFYFNFLNLIIYFLSEAS